ncbi:MAG: hypothetical protein JWN22_3875 [Nocardioides sp.]|jgi:hypothetical protein|nr:hypothetical protein [Nocardioides sp.]
MTENLEPVPAPSAPLPGASVPPPYSGPDALAQAEAGAPVAYAPQRLGAGAPGQIRSTGLCILLAIVTLGIYSLFWFFKTHEEMKRHSGNGLGGGLALVLAFFVGIVMPYITSNEVGALYDRAGQRRPVSAATGLWYFPGAFVLVGPLVWFIKTNGALNAYWRSQGVR